MGIDDDNGAGTPAGADDVPARHEPDVKEQTDTNPAEVFPLAQYLAEEMDARNWSVYDVAARMKTPDGCDLDAFRISMVLAIIDEKLIIDDETVDGLARAFGVSKEFISGLHQAWLDNPSARVSYEAPEGLFHD